MAARPEHPFAPILARLELWISPKYNLLLRSSIDFAFQLLAKFRYPYLVLVMRIAEEYVGSLHKFKDIPPSVMLVARAQTAPTGPSFMRTPAHGSKEIHLP